MEFDTLILKKGFREWFYTQNTEETCEYLLSSKLCGTMRYVHAAMSCTMR